MASLKEISKIPNYNDIKTICHQIWYDSDLTHNKEDDTNIFTILIPPLNLSGNAHFGHAYNLSIQDCIIRYKKMMGHAVALVPGVDHGGISTENAVAKFLLASKGIKKCDITRDEFLNHVNTFTLEKKSNIYEQFKELGCFCNWSNDKYTKSEHVAKFIRNTFVKFWNDGLIYRGTYPSNWCNNCATALSDDEVNTEEVSKKMYYIKYELVVIGSVNDDDGTGNGTVIDSGIVDGTKQYLIVATTRPETIMADAALAINPDDETYKFLGNKYKARIPLTDRLLPIIYDNYVDPTFGTGVLKVTPAHDKNDYKLGIKHKLDCKSIFSKEGTIINVDTYGCKNINEYKNTLIKLLQESNHIDKILVVKSLVHSCYRCANPIETLLTDQYYLKMERFIEHIKNTQVTFKPSHCKNLLNDYIMTCQDWCISRQIHWGHRIPVWICEVCNNVICDNYDDDTIVKCPCNNTATLVNDVLDTWFSSAMWPFAIFTEEETKKYFPSQVLVTGKDIIYFWVARMIMFTKELYGIDPFTTVIFHGMILGNDNKKMTKSRGNVIDPLQVINNFNADTLRVALLWSGTKDFPVIINDLVISTANKKIIKIWNLFRYYELFVFNRLSLIDDLNIKGIDNIFCRWILLSLSNEKKSLVESLDKFDTMTACKNIYNFVHNIFCGEFLEISKFLMSTDKIQVVKTLLYSLLTIVKLLHPFMPYITEYFYQVLKGYKLADKFSILLDGYMNIDTDIDADINFTNGDAFDINNFWSSINILRNLKNKNAPLSIKLDASVEFIVSNKILVEKIVKGQVNFC